MAETLKVMGLMSGTSLDGIDVAVVDIETEQIRPVAFRFTPYQPDVRTRILAVSNAFTHTSALSRLNFELAELYAQALIGVGVAGIELIGCHGQTVYHEGSNTLQLGEAAILAERTGIPVVSNFRARDIAAGGQGAPLVPFFDYRCFRHPSRRRVALNIGGIANITVIPAGAALSDVTAFDTGPGNMVIDQLMSEYTGGMQQFDRNGEIAGSAAPDPDLLRQLIADRYYGQTPPKTAGREQYGVEFIARMKKSGAPFPVLIATASCLTAQTIAKAVGPEPGDLIVSGGGVHNVHLLGLLRDALPNLTLSTTRDFGIDPDAKEAIAFALLAHETWHGRPSNVPGATGAKHAVVLGDLTP